MINSQQDADALSACADASLRTINGSITIGREASGAIHFSNVDLLLNGAITAQDNPFLTSLAFTSTIETDGAIGRMGALTLRNLTGLISVSAPDMWETRGFLLQDLPSLESVNFPALRLMWREFHLKGLPKLRSFIHGAPPGWPFIVSADSHIKDVGLEDIDKFVTSGDDRNITVEGIPNVKLLTYDSMRAANVTIRGNGNLTLHFDCTFCTLRTNMLHEIRATSLTVSGLGAMDISQDVFIKDGAIKKFDVGTFRAAQNSFTLLPIKFSKLNTLHIVDNPNLSALSMDVEFPSYSWKEIVITGNPNLHLNSSDYFWSGGGTTWMWPSGNISTMVFDGPFANHFLSVPPARKGCFAWRKHFADERVVSRLSRGRVN